MAAATFWPGYNNGRILVGVNCVTIPYLGPPLQSAQAVVDPDLEDTGGGGGGGGGGRA